LTSDKIKKITGYLLPFFLMGIFLYFGFKDVNPGEVFEILQNSSIMYLGFFVVVFMLSHYLRALRWKYILGSIKEDASVWRLWGALMVGYGVNCVVPRLGEVYRALFIGKWENLSRSSMLGTIVVERIIDIFVLLLSVIISVIIYSGDLYQHISWLKSTVYVGMIAVIALMVVLYLTVRLKEKFYKGIVKFVGRFSESFAKKLGYSFSMLADGFSTLKGTKNYIYTIALSIIIMLVYAFNSYLGFHVVNMNEIKEVTFSMAWILMTISAFGIVIPTPGGTGSYHAISIFVISQIFGFSAETGAAYAILTHLISYILFILTTVLSIYLTNRSLQKQGKEKENFLSVFKLEREKL